MFDKMNRNTLHFAEVFIRAELTRWKVPTEKAIAAIFLCVSKAAPNFPDKETIRKYFVANGVHEDYLDTMLFWLKEKGILEVTPEEKYKISWGFGMLQQRVCMHLFGAEEWQIEEQLLQCCAWKVVEMEGQDVSLEKAQSFLARQGLFISDERVEAAIKFERYSRINQDNQYRKE